MRAIALLLLLATGCGGYSQNHRRGLMAVGGAAIISGGVIAADGAYCSDVAHAEAGCDNDSADLVAGLSMVVAGLVIGGVAYLIEPKDEDPPAVKSPAVSSTQPRR